VVTGKLEVKKLEIFTFDLSAKYQELMNVLFLLICFIYDVLRWLPEKSLHVFHAYHKKICDNQLNPDFTLSGYFRRLTLKTGLARFKDHPLYKARF
jgi:hypothetical protein